jgi:hypothetical protein
VSFGRRAYRRPLSGAADAVAPAGTEVARLLALAQAVRAEALASGSTLYGGLPDVAAIIAALLQSPNFLMRLTEGQPGADGVSRLDGYEVAGRLAFFLWGQGPDDALLDAAERGELSSQTGVEAAARRMIAAPRTRAHFATFFHQWLELGRIYVGNIDTRRFPSFEPALQDSMYAEVQRLLEDHAWSPDTSLLEVFTADYGYADERLAALYGVPLPQGFGLRRVALGGTPLRGGLLSTAGMLTMGSHPAEPSVVNRGLSVRRRLLCGEIGAPPPNVPDLEPMPGQTLADLQSLHSSDPACASCHRQIDPIGNGLEMYDAIGALRSDPTEAEIRARPRDIEGIEGSEFYGAVELGRLVSQLPHSRACLVENVWRFSMGERSGLGLPELSCSSVSQAFAQSGDRFDQLLVAIATSDAFLSRPTVACH